MPPGALIFLAVQVVLSGLLASAALERWESVKENLLVRSRPLRALDDATDGPGRFVGKLMAPYGRKAPGGSAAAAWSLLVMRSEGDSEIPVCRLSEVSELWLAEDGKQAPLVIAQKDSSRIHEAAAARLLAEHPNQTRITVPPDVLARCRLRDCFDLRAGYSPNEDSQTQRAPTFESEGVMAFCSNRYYGIEVRIETETQVTVSGCRSGPIIKDCDDGHDHLLWKDADKVGQRSLRSGLYELGLLLMLGLVAASLLHSSPLQSLRQLLRTPKHRGGS